MGTLHWKMREILPQMQEEGRLNVLIAMLLRCNIRMRCYPALETLVKDTGLSIATVNRGKNWLAEHGFIVLVPFKKRIDDELSLSRRHNVYQLTGVCTVDGKEYQYLYLTDVAMEELQKRVRDTLTGKVLTSKALESKTLGGKDKGISTPKGNSKKKGNANDTPLSENAQAILDVFLAVQPGYSVDREPHYIQDVEWLASCFTPADIKAFMTEKRKDKFWAMQIMKLQYVKQNITVWKNANKPTVVHPKPAIAPVTTPTLTADELAARKAQGQAARKNLLLGGGR